MPNYFAIGFVGILACVGVGMEYHRQSVQAGIPISEFGPLQFVTGVKDSLRAGYKERSDKIAEVRRLTVWQGEMRQHLPEAPEGWTRRGFDEGDNTPVVPVGKKATQSYGPKHPLNEFKNEAFANLKNLGHITKKEKTGQSDEDFLIEMMTASSFVYEKGEETVLIELLKKDEQETESIGGNALSRSMAFAESLDKYRAEPEPFAVVAGIPFFEAFDREGLMLGHYRVLYAKLGLHEEVRVIVHANAGSDSTRDVLKAVDFEALNRLLRIPMTHVANDYELPDAKSEGKYALISNYVRTVAHLNLRSQTLMQTSAYRTRSKPPALVEKYGAETPLRDMYVMQYRDAMQRLVEIEDIGNQYINMDDLIYKAEPPEEVVQEAMADQAGAVQPDAETADTPIEPAAVKPTMSAPLRRELETLDRSTKVSAVSNIKAPKLAPVKAAQGKVVSKPAAATEKKIKINRLGNRNTNARRIGKKGGCGGGSFCSVSN
ncbi:MAG: hypothetical protein WBC85_12730 [Planktotalea sp.]|uniref:hypothetical protein n=1 Tax=Planktotalea sp. TaxID=2029877 RepID=UPI003C73F29E